MRQTKDIYPLLKFSGAVKREPNIDTWLNDRPAELGALAREWFAVMRQCGPDVAELIHDGHPTVCIEDAAFAYVGVFKAHVNVGFFHGASLSDPRNLLEGSGKYMRHVKLRPGTRIDHGALTTLIQGSYKDIQYRLNAEKKALSRDQKK